MFRKISEEVEVKASINEGWEVYSTFKLAMIIPSELSHLFGIDILKGDGGVGSVFKVTPNPGVSKETAWKERYTKIDYENRVREVEVIEGGYLELGFTSYRITFEFMENHNKNSCILKLTFEYEADEDVLANVLANADPSVFNIKPVVEAFQVINQYIENHKKSKTSV